MVGVVANEEVSCQNVVIIDVLLWNYKTLL